LPLFDKPPLETPMTKECGNHLDCCTTSDLRVVFNTTDVMVETPYTDPRDSKLYTQPGIDPSDNEVYKVYVGQEGLYCRPYQEPRMGNYGKIFEF
jgi:hypothetical protein